MIVKRFRPQKIHHTLIYPINAVILTYFGLSENYTSPYVYWWKGSHGFLDIMDIFKHIFEKPKYFFLSFFNISKSRDCLKAAALNLRFRSK